MQNATQVLTTHAEVVAHLVNNCGIKPGWAQASVTENFTFDHGTFLQRYENDAEFNPGKYTVVGEFNGAPVVSVTGEQAFNWYKGWLDYDVTETAEGITFDGELVYNHEGFYINLAH